MNNNIFEQKLLNDELYLKLGEYNDRICFVEFNDKILIELEDVALRYYLTKLPVYDYLGNIMEQSLCNLANDIEYRYRLQIDEIFIKMLGIRNYIIRTQKTNIDQLITAAVNDITPIGLIILTYHIMCCSTNRYNLSEQLIDATLKLKTIEESYIYVEKKSIFHDIPNIKDNLQTVCFFLTGNKQIAQLKLDNNGYAIDPPRIPYEIMTSHIYHDGGFNQLNTHAKYLKKYLKYKKKYINLINN